MYNIKEKILNKKHQSINLFFKLELTFEEQQKLIEKHNTNNIHEICYKELNNINELPKCKYCGAPALFKNFREGYRIYCTSTKCQYQNRKDLMIQHYGIENNFQSKDTKEKIKQTCLKKYGVENPSQADEIKKKKEETCLLNHNVKFGLQTKYCKNKRKKYLHDHFDEIIQKTKQTCLKKYGVENPSQADEIKKKKEETCLLNWGVTNYWKDPNNRKNFHTKEAHQKEYLTKKKNKSFNSSSSEKTALKLIQEKYSDVLYQYKSELYPFICDFYIPSLDLYIEYNEHWTHGFKPFENTIEDQNKINIWKLKNTKYYNLAIKTWTQRDVNKRKIAKDNQLNWMEFWNLKDLKKWLDF